MKDQERNLAYVSLTQKAYLRHSKVYKIYYSRIFRLISFLCFLSAVIARPSVDEVIIGNSKIFEFRLICWLARFLPTLKYSYINDFFLDSTEDLLHVCELPVFTKMYIIERSAEECSLISQKIETTVINAVFQKRVVQQITNCKILSVKPIAQFPIIYWFRIFKFVSCLLKFDEIQAVSFHPRVNVLERRLYAFLFPNANEINASEVDFKDVEFFGFYSNVMLRAKRSKTNLILFPKHVPFENFIKKLKEG